MVVFKFKISRIAHIISFIITMLGLFILCMFVFNISFSHINYNGVIDNPDDANDVMCVIFLGIMIGIVTFVLGMNYGITYNILYYIMCMLAVGRFVEDEDSLFIKVEYKW